MDGDPETVHHVIFDSIDASRIKSIALCTEGAAGPSGIDAEMVPGLILQPMDSGMEVMRDNFLMSVYSTLMLPPTKKRSYKQRVREVEKATFTPLVLSASGGMACEATHFYKCLALHLAENWMSHIQPQWLGSDAGSPSQILRSAIQSLRGAWYCIGHAVKSHASLSVVNAEAKIDSTHLFD